MRLLLSISGISAPTSAQEIAFSNNFRDLRHKKGLTDTIRHCTCGFKVGSEAKWCDAVPNHNLNTQYPLSISQAPRSLVTSPSALLSSVSSYPSRCHVVFAATSRRQKEMTITYNSGYSLVVTHLTTNPPVRCLNRAERTGSLVFNVLWSYVEDELDGTLYIMVEKKRAATTIALHSL
jgi:hypothetical protein